MPFNFIFLREQAIYADKNTIGLFLHIKKFKYLNFEIQKKCPVVYLISAVFVYKGTPVTLPTYLHVNKIFGENIKSRFRFTHNIITYWKNIHLCLYVVINLNSLMFNLVLIKMLSVSDHKCCTQ